MPLPVIVALASLAAAGTTTGLAIDSALNQPGQPKLPTAPTPLTSTQNAQTTAAVGQQLPSEQALTGGSLSPEAAAQFGATGAGVANNPQASGDIQAAINQFFGLGAPGSSGLTTAPGSTSSGGPGILEMLSKAVPGAGGGGGTPGGSPDFINSMLNSDTFRGLAG
jgi:hypothetical protein